MANTRGGPVPGSTSLQTLRSHSKISMNYSAIKFTKKKKVQKKNIKIIILSLSNDSLNLKALTEFLI